MRTLVLLATLSLAATALAVVPTGTAVGICSEFTDDRCPHTVCLGYSWSYPDPYYRCQRYIDYPCKYCVPWENGVALLP